MPNMLNGSNSCISPKLPVLDEEDEKEEEEEKAGKEDEDEEKEDEKEGPRFESPRPPRSPALINPKGSRPIL